MHVVMFRLYRRRSYGQGWEFSNYLLRREGVEAFMRQKAQGEPCFLTETFEQVLESHNLTTEETAAIEAPDPSE